MTTVHIKQVDHCCFLKSCKGRLGYIVDVLLKLLRIFNDKINKLAVRVCVVVEEEGRASLLKNVEAVEEGKEGHRYSLGWGYYL